MKQNEKTGEEIRAQRGRRGAGMFLFWKIALGNVLKSRRSSVTILIVVFVCVFTMQFGTGYIDGFKKKLTSEFLQQSGHVNIYNELFYKDQDPSMTEHNVVYDAALIEKIRGVTGVTGVRAEINFGALANTETKNLQCMVKALDISKIDENYVRRKNSVIQGRFIEKDGEIAIGHKAAALLRIKPGDKLILLSIDSFGGINAVEGTVTGLYKSNNSLEDEGMAVCGLKMAQELLGIQGKVMSVTVNTDNPEKAAETAAAIQAFLPAGALAVPWQTGQAFVVNMMKMFDVMVVFMAFLLIFAASMGIINSFLMNIMNRLPEFGVLRAMGLSKGQLFMMILTESLLLGAAGTALAVIPGTFVVRHFQANPMNFESIWKIMEGSGIGNMDASIGMVFVPASFLIVVMTGVMISVVASIYPAMVAVKKKPSDIMRVLE